MATGEIIKQKREAKGLTQQQLADATGIKKRLIQTYEQGERNIDHAQIDTLCALCDALNCQITDILEDEALIYRFNKFKQVKEKSKSPEAFASGLCSTLIRRTWWC